MASARDMLRWETRQKNKMRRARKLVRYVFNVCVSYFAPFSTADRTRPESTGFFFFGLKLNHFASVCCCCCFCNSEEIESGGEMYARMSDRQFCFLFMIFNGTPSSSLRKEFPNDYNFWTQNWIHFMIEYVPLGQRCAWAYQFCI